MSWHVTANLLTAAFPFVHLPLPSPPAAAGEFFNHCCDPNAWWEDDYRLVARRRIPAGTEITYDYCTEDMEVAGFDCGALSVAGWAGWRWRGWRLLAVGGVRVAAPRAHLRRCCPPPALPPSTLFPAAACGAATCRKRVSSSDWARPDMWAAYNTHWKSHILAEITALQAKQAKASPAGPTPVPVLASPLLSSSSSAAACGGLETLASSPTAGNKVVIPPAALNWTADPTASAANAGGRNRSSSAGAAGDEANTDASTSASELASEAASMEEAASVGSVSDGEAPTALAVA